MNSGNAALTLGIDSGNWRLRLEGLLSVKLKGQYLSTHINAANTVHWTYWSSPRRWEKDKGCVKDKVILHFVQCLEFVQCWCHPCRSHLSPFGSAIHDFHDAVRIHEFVCAYWRYLFVCCGGEGRGLKRRFSFGACSLATNQPGRESWADCEQSTMWRPGMQALRLRMTEIFCRFLQSVSRGVNVRPLSMSCHQCHVDFYRLANVHMRWRSAVWIWWDCEVFMLKVHHEIVVICRNNVQ